MSKSKLKAPSGLADSGSALWSSIADVYELRADELRVLEDASREADLITTLNDGLRGEPLMVSGSMGQDVINPLISELRQHRATLASLLRQLKLPDDNEAASAGSRSAAARAAVNARWAKRGA